ncbi:hypothetical protein BASA50_004658 [Batrachochytrium salamandrivorans]|uniref:Uncharacterized protein n=1 Tax=Batrachochytrium salamandrivorans TaxID=1357716 RepID=A0ABQ8FEZ2_9FUNG|nr:hypothetical protein BASA50_004658 [Batrachochytrium salamandrivorans]
MKFHALSLITMFMVTANAVVVPMDSMGDASGLVKRQEPNPEPTDEPKPSPTDDPTPVPKFIPTTLPVLASNSDPTPAPRRARGSRPTRFPKLGMFT